MTSYQEISETFEDPDGVEQVEVGVGRQGSEESEDSGDQDSQPHQPLPTNCLTE